jgi:TolB-like protein
MLTGIAVTVGAGYWLTRPKGIDPFRVAVLPMRNLTGDPEKQYLADETTEALVTGLARAGTLHVVSSTTSRRYATSERSLPEIAKALGARWVVEGGMGFERSRVILKLRAVDATSDQKVWADFFESDIDALSATQAKAAAGIAESIQRAAK